jgi:hypothetical protein
MSSPYQYPVADSATCIGQRDSPFQHHPRQLCDSTDCQVGLSVWSTGTGGNLFRQGPSILWPFWAVFCKEIGVKHTKTTAYHPQCNGMVERFHRQLKAALRARSCGLNWFHHLPWVLHGLRAPPKNDTGISSAKLVFGCKLVLPGKLLHPPEQVDSRKIQVPSPPHITRLGKERHVDRPAGHVLVPLRQASQCM